MIGHSPSPGKPHIVSGDDPRWITTYDLTDGVAKAIRFNDYVCYDHRGFYGRGETARAAFYEYVNNPRRPGDCY